MLVDFAGEYQVPEFSTDDPRPFSRFTKLSYKQLLEPSLVELDGNPADIDRRYDELHLLMCMFAIDRSDELREAIYHRQIMRWSVSVIHAHQMRVRYTQMKRGGSYSPYHWKDYHVGYRSCIAFWTDMLETKDLSIVSGMRAEVIESGLLFVLERFSIFANREHLGRLQFLVKEFWEISVMLKFSVSPFHRCYEATDWPHDPH